MSVKPLLECLEDRTLLSAAILGSLRNQGGPVAGQTILLNQNDLFSPSNTAISATTGTNLDTFLNALTNTYGLGPVAGSAIPVTNLPSVFQDLAVNLNLTNNSPDPITVTLDSPLTQVIPNLEILFTIQPGQTFDGSFDGNSTNPITLATPNAGTNVIGPGSFAPQQPFSNPQFGIYNVGINNGSTSAPGNGTPNGVWGLVFYGGSASDYNSLVLNNLSLNFTVTQPSVTTDAQGNYAFTGLAAGTYSIAPSLANTPGIVPQTVTLVDGQSLSGINFAVKTNPDLTGVSFQLASSPIAPGQSITVQYTIANQGAGDAPEFSVGLYLSSTGLISASSDILLGTLQFDGTNGLPVGLAAGAAYSGTMTVTLPSVTPVGFGVLANDSVGFIIDPANSLTESVANQSNQGMGIDLAWLGGQVNGTGTNVAVTTSPGVHQDPSLAVDPTNPKHLVTAYMDNSLTQNQTTSTSAVLAGIATITPVVMEPDFIPGAYLLIDKGLADQETIQILSVSGSTFTATFSAAHPAGFTIDSLLYAGIGIAVSYDGGQTWTTTSITLPEGYDQGAANPTVAFDGAGNVYVSFQASTYQGTLPDVTANLSKAAISDGFQASNGIFVARSTTGGLTWDQPVAVTANSYTPGGQPVVFDEFPDMAIDTFGSAATNPYYGHIDITWTRFYPAGQFPGDPTSQGGSQLFFAYSDDLATTWNTQYQMVPGTGAATGTVSALQDPLYGSYDGSGSYDKYTTITVGPGGGVYITANAGGNAILFYSTDGGESTNQQTVSGFTAPNPAAQLGFLTTENEYLQTNPTFSSSDSFRTLYYRRLIVAVPNTPGVLYAVGPNSLSTTAVSGGAAIDANGIYFAVSDDFGQTWNSDYTVGTESQSALLGVVPSDLLSYYEPVLNDDNGGFFPGYASSLTSQVVSSQAMPSISISPNGTIAVIWYDNRSDPTGQMIEVWGTVSTDGGKTFTANFPVSDTSFNPNTGQFESPNGNTSYYLGDQIGVAATNGTAYAVWTDTRNGNQQIETTSFSLVNPPPAPVDRFGPNQTQSQATPLGTISASEEIPRLVLAAGNSQEWFSLVSGSSGLLSISVNGGTANDLQLTLIDSSGQPISGAITTNITNSAGEIIGQNLVAPCTAGTTSWIQVSGNSSTTVDYTMNLGAITGDLGTQVTGTTTGTVGQGGQNLYRLETAVSGFLQVNLSSSLDVVGGLNLAILGADGQSVLLADSSAGVGPGANESSPLTIAVTAGQVVFLQVSGANLTSAQGDFTLQYTNLDQFESSGITSLFYPTQGNPTAIAVADLGNGTTDLLVSNTDTTDTLGVLLGNGDGTFAAEAQYGVGPGLGGANTTAGTRQFAVTSLTPGGPSDVIVPNLRTGDVSVLLGNGDGTFQPQRRFNAVSGPGALATGVFTSSGFTDTIVLENYAQNGDSFFAFLQGNGNGTFNPPVLYQTDITLGATGIVVGAFGNPNPSENQNNLDIIIYSKNSQQADIFYGNGDGTFTQGPDLTLPEPAFNATTATINGTTYLITTGTNTGNIYVMASNGLGQFAAPTTYNAWQPQPGEDIAIQGLAVTDFGNTTVNGPLNIVVTAAPVDDSGAARVILFPGNGDGTFGTPWVIATVGTDGNIAAGNFGNGTTDLAIADKGGITILFGQPLALTPNDSPSFPRNLGDADHLITQPEAIVPGHPSAYYHYTVPMESAPGTGDQIVDLSALFQDTVGSGLYLQVSVGNQILTPLQSSSNSASGDRVRVMVPQGTTLTIEIAGVDGNSFGVYTLDVDVLPQLVVSGVQGESAIPGGPVTSIVLTVQGDLLDPAAAQNPANYIVTWNGPLDNQVIPVATIGGGLPVVYCSSADIDVASGLVYPNEGRQTITLLFASTLPAGSYTISLSPDIQSAALNSSENQLLVDVTDFGGHPIVSVNSSTLSTGSRITTTIAIPLNSRPDPSAADAIVAGTPFLSQLQNDLSGLLDSLIQSGASETVITTAINNEIYSRFLPVFLSGLSSSETFGIVWLDPVSIGMVAPAKQATTGSNGLVTPSGAVTYNSGSTLATNSVSRTFVEVGGNVELIVQENVLGTFDLNVSNVPVQARGGSVILTNLLTQINSLTQDLQRGICQYSWTFPDLVAGLISPSGLFNTSTVIDTSLAGISGLSSEFQLVLLSTLIGGGSFETAVAANSLANVETIGIVIPTLYVKQQLPVGDLDNSSRELSSNLDPLIEYLRIIPGVSSQMVNRLATVINTGGQVINKALNQLLDYLGNSNQGKRPSAPMAEDPARENSEEPTDQNPRSSFLQENIPVDDQFQPSAIWEKDQAWLGLSLISGVILTGFTDLRSRTPSEDHRWKRWIR